eukprot:TRINITY_DN2571_c0_g1_i2.p1 TRINITY_DN2571_c0_g1~~TRINITY_DN2571_c0_g1_i2.p1  ORF type:complete len:514 (+),score=64.44 TRINITY_DN2571_c0_g1_i2:628-2169(+)
MRRMIPPSLESLDISPYPFNKPLAAILIRWSLSGMRLKYLTLSSGIQERYAGVIGFTMQSSPHLRVLEVKGTPPFWLLTEAVKHCGSLKELLTIPSGGDREADTPPNPTIASFILSGSKSLHMLALSAVTAVPRGLHGAALTDKMVHQHIKKLRLEGVGSMQFSGVCDLPNLVSLSVFEGAGATLTMPEVLNLVWNSPNLTELTVAAGFRWAVEDVQTLHSRCHGIQRLRLKAGSDGSERWVSVSPTHQISGKTFDALLHTFKLKELHVEAAGWDPHWTVYHDVVGRDSLVLQTELDSLVTPIVQHLSNPMNSFIRCVTTVVLYGDVSNPLVWAILEHCHVLERLELYLLPPSSADDDVLTPPGFREGFSKRTLKWLHIHDNTPQHLTSQALLGIREKFPCLTSLGVVGLCNNVSPKNRGFEGVLQTISSILPPITSLVLGPVLDTSAELLCLIKENPSLTSLSLAWNGGELPTRDDEFPSALGLSTLQELASLINPDLTVKDVGCGHFNILL